MFQRCLSVHGGGGGEGRLHPWGLGWGVGGLHPGKGGLHAWGGVLHPGEGGGLHPWWEGVCTQGG